MWFPKDIIVIRRLYQLRRALKRKVISSMQLQRLIMIDRGRSYELISLWHSWRLTYVGRRCLLLIRLNPRNISSNSLVFVAGFKLISSNLSCWLDFRSVTLTFSFNLVNLLLRKVVLFHLDTSLELFVSLLLLLFQRFLAQPSFLHLLLQLFLISEFCLNLCWIDQILSFSDIRSHSDSRDSAGIASALHHLLWHLYMGRWGCHIIPERRWKRASYLSIL